MSTLHAVNFLLSGWVGTVLSKKINNENQVLLKCKVRRSQTITHSHSVWVCTKPDGYVETAGCTCMTGLARVCSHIGALLFKILHASKENLTGNACTDTAQTWNKRTTKEVYPQKAKRLKPDRTYDSTVSPEKKFLQHYSYAEYRQSIENSIFKNILNHDTVLLQILSVSISKKIQQT